MAADPVALALLLRQVRKLLASQQALGITAYPATAELRKFVAYSPHSAAFFPSKVPIAPKTNPVLAKKQALVPANELLSLADFTTQVANCRRCSPNALPRLGLGNTGVKLAVVGDYCLGVNPSKNIIWGQGEDEMLWRMITAIGLSKEEVYVTNVVKCCQEHELKLGSEAERLCHSWLNQELRLVQPKLICAMGDIAANVLLGKQHPASIARWRRDKFYPCGLPSITALVRPTYHPRFLLQQPEMKQATWEDLQAIQRRLKDL